MEYSVARGEFFDIDLALAGDVLRLRALEIYPYVGEIYVEAGEPLPNGGGLPVRPLALVREIHLEVGDEDQDDSDDSDAEEDVLLLDVGLDDLRVNLATALERGYLSEARADQASWPMRGILYGPKDRPVVNAVFTRGDRSVNVFCLVDTCSPNTYMSMDTLRALGAADTTAECVKVLVHGEEMDVTLSSRHFKDLNLIGADFMRRTRTRLLIDYSLCPQDNRSRVELVRIDPVGMFWGFKRACSFLVNAVCRGWGYMSMV